MSVTRYTVIVFVVAIVAVLGLAGWSWFAMDRGLPHSDQSPTPGRTAGAEESRDGATRKVGPQVVWLRFFRDGERVDIDRSLRVGLDAGDEEASANVSKQGKLTVPARLFEGAGPDQKRVTVRIRGPRWLQMPRVFLLDSPTITFDLQEGLPVGKPADSREALHLDIELARYVTRTIEVVDHEGEPAAGISCTIDADSDADVLGSHLIQPIGVETDDAGLITVELPVIPKGRYEVSYSSVEDYGVLRGRTAFGIDGGEPARLELAFKDKLATLELVLETADGQVEPFPLPRRHALRLTVSGWDDDRYSGGIGGRFGLFVPLYEYDGAPLGERTIGVRGVNPRSRRWFKRRFKLKQGANVVTLRSDPSSSPRRRVIVVRRELTMAKGRLKPDHPNAWFADAVVRVPELGIETPVDGEGRFQLSEFPKGRWEVVAEGPGFVDSSPVMLDTSGSGFEIPVDAHAVLTVAPLGLEHLPDDVEVFVWFRREGSSPAVDSMRDVRQTRTKPVKWAGLTSIHVQYHGKRGLRYRTQIGEVDIKPNSETVANVRFPEVSILRVKVRGGQAKGHAVGLRRKTTKEWVSQGMADEEGEAAIIVPPGEYGCWIGKPDRSAEEVTVVEFYRTGDVEVTDGTSNVYVIDLDSLSNAKSETIEVPRP